MANYKKFRAWPSCGAKSLGRCTGSWGILARGEGQLGEVLVEGSVSWGTLTCRISWAQFSDGHYSIGKIYSIINKL